MIKIVCFQLSGCGSIPSWGTKILHATWYGPKKKKKERNLIKREKLNFSFSFSNSIAKGQLAFYLNESWVVQPSRQIYVYIP